MEWSHVAVLRDNVKHKDKCPDSKWVKFNTSGTQMH